MSDNILAPHTNMKLLKSLPVAVENGAQTVKHLLTTHRMYQDFVFRLKVDFEHGETKPSAPKFGGIYNLIKGSHILFNSQDKEYVKSGKALYVDSFKRKGRENDNVNYGDLPASLTQEIDYSFAGNQSVLGGIMQIYDGVFALDLRHDAVLQNNTYNSVELVIETNELGAVFESLGDTKLKAFTIEVYGRELFHDAASAKFLGVSQKRYAKIITETQDHKVADLTLVQDFNLSPMGDAAKGNYLSDIAIMQLDEAGAAVPFDDENQIVKVKIGENDFYSCPVWEIRRAQNARRLQPVPPNVLIVPLVQFESNRGGLSPKLLATGAKLSVWANDIEGQTGCTKLFVEKNYTTK